MSIFLHEMGHALVSRAVGFRTFCIVIGSGFNVWLGRFLGFRLALNVYPLDGAVIATPKTPESGRWRQFLYIAGGPVANAVLLAIALMARWPSETWLASLDEGWAAWQVLAAANALLLLTSLWPQQVKTAAGRVPSDGRQLWRIFTGDKTIMAQAHRHGFLLEASECREYLQRAEALAWIERGLALNPEDFGFLQFKNLMLIEEGNLAAARESDHLLLARTDLDPVHRATVQNGVAYAGALMGGEEALAEADRMSAEALAALPWNRPVQNTRGVFLLMAGRLEEALPLLRKTLVEPKGDPSAAAQTRCLLAIAEMQAGNRAEAERLAAEAREQDPRCFLLPRVDAGLGETEARKMAAA
jgi:tetratricopeptide (TPR) repeat protein